MSAVLLLPLVGPMQSWGTRSRFTDRDTEREPTKSGVIGLLCAALGRGRDQAVEDLAALKMGVRVDQPGLRKTDFQTAQGVLKADRSGTDSIISNRHYLTDAAFLVGLEGPDELLSKLYAALKAPVYPLFLGRRSYVPSIPVFLPDGLRTGRGLREALLDYPRLSVRANSDDVRLIFDSDEPTHEIRKDVPVSFAIADRKYQERFIRSEVVPASAMCPQVSPLIGG